MYEVIEVMLYSGVLFVKVVGLQDVVQSPKYVDVLGLIIIML